MAKLKISVIWRHNSPGATIGQRSTNTKMAAFQKSGWEELSRVLDDFGPDLCDVRWLRQCQDPELPYRSYDLLDEVNSPPRQDRDGRLRQLAELVRHRRVVLPTPPEEEDSSSVAAASNGAGAQPTPPRSATAEPPPRPAPQAAPPPRRPEPQPVTSPPAQRPTPPVAPPPTDRTAPPRTSPPEQPPAGAGEDEAAAAQAAALRRASDRGDPVVEIQYQSPATGSGRSTS